MPILTDQEWEIFSKARHGNWDVFTERYFRLPASGTYFTPEDRPARYEALYDIWKQVGRPEAQFDAVIDGEQTEIHVRYVLGAYEGEPVFLLPHGFRMLPWLREFLNPQTPLGIAIAGAGSGKTSGVAIFALTCCALFPGFRFLNVAPSEVQARLMLDEIEKWCSETEFSRFIVKGRGANPLWTERPYPTITIEVYDGRPSTFICQTVRNKADAVLGGERDFINCDEAQLLENITASIPILATRLRGTRNTGELRWGMLRWIGNPGRNAELTELMDYYSELQEDKQAVVIESLPSDANIYITKHQLRMQALSLRTDRDKARWHFGQMSAVTSDSEIDESLLQNCVDEEMSKIVAEEGEHDDTFGLVRYELERVPHHLYIVAGDTGKSNLSSLASLNVPAVGAFDMTYFPEKAKLVAFRWESGNGSYATFIRNMQQLMRKYGGPSCTGFYDAQNVQTALEDTGGAGSLAEYPTVPVYFGGSVEPKRWAFAIMTQLLQDQVFQWPYIKGLWHQARVYNPSSTKVPDDIIAMLLTFCLGLRLDSELWDRLTRKYDWLTDDEQVEKKSNEAGFSMADRHARYIP